jgi:hypothetical protein
LSVPSLSRPEAGWIALLAAHAEGGLPARAFHDRFLAAWREARDTLGGAPAAVEALFFVVEAFDPDPGLRTPPMPWDADEAELAAATRAALARLRAEAGGG